jgi:hypothetical protein
MNMLRSLMGGMLMLLALITVPVTALAAISGTIDPDLVGLWHMDGDWGDSSGNGNPGTPYNGVSFSSSSKIGTSCGSFNGTNNYVRLKSTAFIANLPQSSVEAWIYPTSVSVASGSYSRAIYSENIYGGTVFNLAVNGSGNVTFGVWRSDVPGYWQSVQSSSVLSVNNWYHVVGTIDSSGMKLYVNDLPPATNSANRPSNGTISEVGIGRVNNSGGRDYFAGLVDEVAIYKRALSATEIQERYQNYAVKVPTLNPVTSPIATSTITLSGTKPANSAIVVNGNVLVPLDGTTNWQANYTLSQGTNTISVTALDSQNRNSLPVTLSVILDTTPPQVTATTPVNNGILKTAPAVVTFTLTDALSPLNFAAALNGATVRNASGSNIAGTWSTSGSGTTGSVTFTPSAPLSDELYTATIKPTDTLANGSIYTLTFTIDGTPPVAPGIDPVTAPINTSSKTIIGTKSSDSTSVAVSCAGATIGAMSYPTATTWSVNVSGLQVGSNTINAYAVDTAGNQSATATATITVDTTPPTVAATPAGGIYKSTQSVALAANEPTVIYYTTDGSTPTASATVYSQPISIQADATLKYFGRDLAGNDSEIKTEDYVIDTTPPLLAMSTLSDGAYTNNEILNVAGTVTDNTGVKGITVNDTAVQLNEAGGFSYALTLKNGGNFITVAATDSAGNVATDTRAVTLDQTSPVLAVTTPADNSKTGHALLEVSGTVDKTSTVTIKRTDIVQSAIMDGGNFSASIPLNPGYNTIEITAVDLAGNQSSLKRTVVFDDQVPSLAVTVPNQDTRTNQSSLTVQGTVSDPLTAVSVTVSMGNEIFTPPVIDGKFEQTVNFTDEKTDGIVVTATNEVGASASVQRNVIYDITPPALSIDPVTSPTRQSSLSVTGTREAGAEVTVTCATATVGEVSYPTATTWQVYIAGLRKGENVITSASADAAGNAVTATATVVLATGQPQITVTATPDVIWPPNHKMVPVTIAGGVDANGSAIKSVSISVTDGYGTYEYSNLAFGSTVMLEAWRKGNDMAGRKYTITVVVTDTEGITTAKTATVTVPHDKTK